MVPLHVEVLALAHATPLAQHAPPHCDVPAGQPHVPAVGFRQATPALQQHGPQGVVPARHGAGPTLAGPAHVTASARTGLRTRAIATPLRAAPITLRAPRRVVVRAIACDNSSNR